MLCPESSQQRFTVVTSETLSSVRQLVMNTTLQQFVDDVVESSNFQSIVHRLEEFEGENRMIFIFLRQVRLLLSHLARSLSLLCFDHFFLLVIFWRAARTVLLFLRHSHDHAPIRDHAFNPAGRWTLLH